jgi:PBSX family phage terminase large subunit
MNRLQAQLILEELLRRKSEAPLSFIEKEFTTQTNFILDPSRLKVAQCTRRAGKSYGAGLYLFKEAYENPGVSVVYIGLTRAEAKRIMVKDILSSINERFKLHAKFNASELSYTLPNGSVIYLLGVDAKPAEMDKLLGQKFKLCIIDEAAMYTQDLHKLVYEVLKPAVADYRGTICLISTTSDITRGLYYDITTGKQPGWSVHKWSALDNPHMKDNFKAEMESLIETHPGIQDTPSFKRMYLNEWYIDDASLIYRFDSHRNLVETLPNLNYNYVLGIDLGYEDATAFVVTAYSEHAKELYVVETFSAKHMIVSDVADKIKELRNRYNFATMVVDGASKQVVEELKRRYSIPLVAAIKSDKKAYIEMFNSDLILGNIKLLRSTTDQLRQEWVNLVWDVKKREAGVFVEHSSCDNHLSDAMLYAWRWCHQYAWSPKFDTPHPNSEAAVNKWWDQEEERLLAIKNEDNML